MSTCMCVYPAGAVSNVHAHGHVHVHVQTNKQTSQRYKTRIFENKHVFPMINKVHGLRCLYISYVNVEGRAC